MIEITSVTSHIDKVFYGLSDGRICSLSNNLFINYSKQSNYIHYLSNELLLSAHGSDLILWDLRYFSKPSFIKENLSVDDITCIDSFNSAVVVSDEEGILYTTKNMDKCDFKSTKYHENIISSVKFSFNGNMVYSAGFDCKVNCLNEDSIVTEFNLNSLEDEVDDAISHNTIVSLTPPFINDMIILDEQHLLCGSENCSLDLLKLNSNHIEYENSFISHKLGVSNICKTENFVVSVSNDKQLIYWKLEFDDNGEMLLEDISKYTHGCKFNYLTRLTDNEVCIGDVEDKLYKIKISNDGNISSQFLYNPN